MSDQYLYQNISSLFADYLERCPIAIGIFDTELRYVKVNRLLALLNEIPAEAHIGRTVREVLPGLADRIEPLLREVLGSGSPRTSYELATQTAEVESLRRYWYVNYFPLFAEGPRPVGVGAILVETTELRRSEEARGLLESLLIGSSDALFVKDLAGRYLLINPAGATMLGRTVEQVIGRTDSEVFPKESSRRILERDAEILKSGVCRTFEEEYTFTDRVRALQTTKSPYRDVHGKIIGLIGIARDITLAKQHEKELEDANRQLRFERELRARLVAGLSHDLRSPLTAARAAADLICSRDLSPEKTRQLAQRVVEAMKRGDHLIRDMLDASLIQAGQQLRILLERTDLRAVISETLSDLATVHGDRFHLIQESAGHLEGWWDKETLRRVIENLCNNAVRYGEALPISVRLAGDAETCRISVHNYGSPITPPDQVSIFSRFENASPEPRTSVCGRGLGLTVVKGIAESHGGRVEVESAAAVGTVFTVTLPVDARPFQVATPPLATYRSRAAVDLGYDRAARPSPLPPS